MTDSPRRPLEFTVPAHLPGEDAYGAFMTHLTACAECGYGQTHCERATELWRAYRAAKKRAKRRT